MIFASICTGGGLVDVGARQAGFISGWGIEINAAIADVAQQNLGHTVIAKSVTEVDFSKLAQPDLLWWSPPCPSFSVAKQNRKETAADKAIAWAIVDAIKTLAPPVFVLENVEGYKRSKSLEFIEGALYALGYWVDRQVLNFADYGVPQTRRRLILRAVKGSFVPPLPVTQQWQGWLGAIADLIPALEETELAQWQINQLPERIQTILFQSGNLNGNNKEKFRRPDYPAPTVCASESRFKAFLLDITNTCRAATIRDSTEPSYTILSGAMRWPISSPKAFLIHPTDQRTMPIIESSHPSFTLTANKGGNSTKALLVSGIGNRKDAVTVRSEGEPSFTQTASSANHPAKDWLEHGRVVRLSPRAIARLQTVPDWYELPESNRLAATIIGNGVPCLAAEKLLNGLREVL